MSTPMSNAGDVLPPISFTFEYEGYGSAHASISNGAETYGMDPSYVLGDPLFLLLHAVVEILRNGSDDTGCEWWYEPALYGVAVCRCRTRACHDASTATPTAPTKNSIAAIGAPPITTKTK